MIIHVTNNEQHLQETRRIFSEYYDELLNIDTDSDEFDQELSQLPGDYSAPDGALLLAIEASIVIGCVALRKISPQLCEMKRLYVQPEYRGQGWGKRLAEEIITEARSRAYSDMRLDTLDTLAAANGLYQSLGFKQIDAYLEETTEPLLYWNLSLL
ncbi:MAG: GNAT family N-acetyltransferase [Gammaproteobacteria bacterium]|nr:GNAT family N-acetyltransferase [Gammaproteobacteria bacterium]